MPALPPGISAYADDQRVPMRVPRISSLGMEAGIDSIGRLGSRL